MLQYLPQLPIIIAFLIAFAGSASRILTATRPFWGQFPAWAQTLAPQAVLALGALGSGLAGGVKSLTDLTVVFIGAGALLLPGLPSNRSAAPMQAGKPVVKAPSAGDVAVAAVVAGNNSLSVPPGRMFPSDPPLPPNLGGLGALLLAVCFAVHVTGCAWFKGSFWPNVEHCAPSPASLVSQVADILVAGGDYEAALKQLALQDGGAAVICAVQAFVSSIASKVAASHDDLSGAARGKAFLAQHPVGQ